MQQNKMKKMMVQVIISKIYTESPILNYHIFIFSSILFLTMPITSVAAASIIVAIYITLSSFSLISISFIAFILQLTLGNLLARIGFEFSLLLLTICKNTTEINDKLSKTKKETKEEKKDKE